LVAAVVLLSAHLAPSLPRRAWSQLRFLESAEAAGLGGFRLISGDREKRYIVEANSAGVCVIDYDSYDRPDLYFVNGGYLESFREGRPSRVRHALFRDVGERRFEESSAGLML